MPTSAGSCRNGTVGVGPLSTSVKCGPWWQVAQPASLRNSRSPRLAAARSKLSLRRLRRAQAQLVVQQRRQLRRDQIWRLIDEQPDAGIVEGALSAHLADADVAVPVRDRAITGERLEADAVQSIDRRESRSAATGCSTE